MRTAPSQTAMSKFSAAVLLAGQGSVFVVLLATCLSVAAFGADPPLRIVVEAGDRSRLDCPVSVTLTSANSVPRAVHLVEMTNGGAASVAMQIEADDPPRLWWILSGITDAGA